MKNGIYIRSGKSRFQKTGYVDDIWNKKVLSAFFSVCYLASVLLAFFSFNSFWTDVSYFFFNDANPLIIISVLNFITMIFLFIIPLHFINEDGVNKEHKNYEKMKATNNPDIIKECLQHYAYLEKNKNIKSLSKLILLIKKLPYFLQFILLSMLVSILESNVHNSENKSIMNLHFHHVDLSYLFIFTIQKDKLLAIQQ